VVLPTPDGEEIITANPFALLADKII